MTLIWAACKDPGGTAGIIPVVEKLRAIGYDVVVIADGKAKELLRGKEEYISGTVDELINRPLPHLLLTYMSSKGGIGRDLTVILKGKLPVVALQDFWGARLWTDWKSARPDYICVNDEVGSQIVQQSWPDFTSDQIKITGYPALDKYADYDIVAEAAKPRSILGFVEEKPIILYAGQVKLSGEVLSEVVEILNMIKRDVYLIPRKHLRMKDDAPEELPKWERALAKFSNGTLISDSSACDTSSLIACATVVLAMFSTVLLEAATLRRQNISILYPDAGMRRFYEETGGQLKEFPLVELGCSAKATNRQELIMLLKKALEGELGLESKQESVFRLDGRNAERVARFIKSLL